ncbi:putative cytochrome P450 [Bisporella sp. PMI_857]|nr:putative cytochrome P450 [Bisporella sp. PMI_857]
MLSVTFNYTSLFFSGLILWIFYAASIVLRRIYFSPLSHIPGSKLAIASLWYECYYDVFKRGLYFKKIQEMHKRYGPIIRINSHEIHIDDPEYYDELYNNTEKWDKYQPYMDQFGLAGALVSTAPHDLHRLRRKPLQNYFSRRAVVALESSILSNLEILCNKLSYYKQEGDPMELHPYLVCFAADVASEYTFGESYNLQTEGTGEQKKNYSIGFREAGEAVHTLKQWPLLATIFKLDEKWVSMLSPAFKLLVSTSNIAKRKVFEIIAEETAQPGKGSSMFHALLRSDLPPHEKSAARLANEGHQIVAAAGESTGSTIETTLYHLVDQPAKLARLRGELATVSSFTWSNLEQLPYFNAVVKEGLRINSGIAGRLPRCAPDRDTWYNDILIPRGTPVSMSAPDVHYNPTVFENPRSFVPERWLQDANDGDKKGTGLNRFLVPFSKGTRHCLGMNLAYAEIFLALAILVTRFDFELYETTIDDVEMRHDLTISYPELGSQRVRVFVK